MSDTDKTTTPEVHPSEQGPFADGKVLGLGEQPVTPTPEGQPTPVIGVAASDKDAVKAYLTTEYNKLSAQIDASIAGLTTNPSPNRSNGMSTLNFLRNHVAAALRELR